MYACMSEHLANQASNSHHHTRAVSLSFSLQQLLCVLQYKLAGECRPWHWLTDEQLTVRVAPAAVSARSVGTVVQKECLLLRFAIALEASVLKANL
jgi:hypothetical protein